MTQVICSLSCPLRPVALIIGFVALGATLVGTASAQNTLGYPTRHELVALSGKALAQPIRSDGIVTANGPRGTEIRIGPNQTVARAEYRIQVPRGTCEIIPSWAARTPGNSGIRIYLNLPQSGGWFEAGSWGRVPDSPPSRDLRWSDGSRYISSYAKLASPVSEVDVAVELYRSSPTAESPRLWRVVLSCAPKTRMRRPLLVAGNFGAVRGQPVDSGVAFIPQVNVGRKDWVERTCSPAVMCMMLSRHGINRTVLDLATRTYDRPADAFGVWNRAIMSAVDQGLDGYVTRLRNWGEVHQALSEGSLVGASIRMEPGEVKDPLNRFGRRLEGTKGHIILIRGINGDGTVVTNDPASKDYGGNLTWDPAELGRAWFVKGGVAYIVNR